jgi:hypothetical protein
MGVKYTPRAACQSFRNTNDITHTMLSMENDEEVILSP